MVSRPRFFSVNGLGAITESNKLRQSVAWTSEDGNGLELFPHFGNNMNNAFCHLTFQRPGTKHVIEYFHQTKVQVQPAIFKNSITNPST